MNKPVTGFDDQSGAAAMFERYRREDSPRPTQWNATLDLLLAHRSHRGFLPKKLPPARLRPSSPRRSRPPPPPICKSGALSPSRIRSARPAWPIWPAVRNISATARCFWSGCRISPARKPRPRPGARRRRAFLSRIIPHRRRRRRAGCAKRRGGAGIARTWLLLHRRDAQ